VNIIEKSRLNIMLIKRTLEDKIKKSLFKGKIIILYGARRVGKTTLVKKIPGSLYLNCDEPDIKDAFTGKTSTELKSFIGNHKLVVIDEAQRVKDIGLALKLLADNFPDMQVIATGSSSFELSNSIVEPLTGRKLEFFLYPFSIEELSSVYSGLEIDRLLENRIIYGMYPDVVFNSDNKGVYLKELARSYSYKDVLAYQNIKNHDALVKLLQALALQIGNEVSYNEVSNLLGIDKKTVESYVHILEKAFIIFRLPSFNTNKRNELTRLRKIYFYDTGIRNALINNLNPLNLRQDTGTLWENFIISERIKLLRNHGIDRQFYFWRTLSRQEIDYVEEEAGFIRAFEIKWKENRLRIPKPFPDAYPKAECSIINNKNFKEFIGKL
jgi:hypothetical protein